MKKIRWGVLLVLIVAMLGGCGSQATLTEEEDDMVAEYLSKLVLSRDKYYDQGLQDYEYYQDALNGEEDTTKADNTMQVADSTTQAADEKPETNDKQEDNSAEQQQESTQSVVQTSTQSSNETNAATVDVNDVFNKKNFNVSYKSSNWYTSYPSKDDSPYFSIDGKDGYQLLVVRFNVKNSSSDDASFNLIEDSISYTLTIGGKTYQPLMTLLVNDLQFIDLSIGAGKIEKGELVFQIPEDSKSSEASLSITNGSKNAVVEIQ